MARLPEKSRRRLQMIAKACRKFRIDNRIKLVEIANDLGTTEQTISGFEHGKNNSAVILGWYLDHGIMEYYPAAKAIGLPKTDQSIGLGGVKWHEDK